MKVYLNGERPARAKRYVMNVCPAEHLKGTGEMPAEWVTEANEPITFPIEFVYGVADVPTNLGTYMTKYGLAAKTRLYIPEGVQVA
jgi:hypothetical protein